jgi:Flp pilus assembly protein TadG
MRSVNNERGSVLVFMTLMIVLLLVMVGMGLDTGQLTYTRSQGQAAVDAAALSAVSGLPFGVTADAEVKARAAAFDSKNDYLNSPNNQITGNPSNLTYVQYDSATGAITSLPGIAGANGVRVALETTNPYTTVAAGTAMKSPVFLTPLLKLFGQSAPGTADVSVSAVAAIRAIPGIPIAVMQGTCGGNNVWLRQSNANVDNSCWTTYTQNPPSASAVQALFGASASCSGLPAGSGAIMIGTDIELNNGQQASTYDAASQLFLTDNPGSCWMVPVISDSSNCTKQSAIVDWAEICPTAVVKQGSPKYIAAKVTCGQDLYRIKSNLCFSSRLLRDTKSGM